MQAIRLKKGYRFQIDGGPSTDLVELGAPPLFGVSPERVPFIKPRLKVSEGDSVQAGSVLFEDKRNPAIVFLSPVGGTVSRIVFGPRRVIRAIIVEPGNSTKAPVVFPSLSLKKLETMDRARLTEHILKGGLWWVFRQLPFRDMPEPTSAAPMIIVSLSAKEPFQPSPSVYLRGRADIFEYGLKVLEKLANGKVLLFGDKHDTELMTQCGDRWTHAVLGDYPSDDPGAVLYRIKTSAADNRAWYIMGQDVLLLAELLSGGRYPTRRVVCVAGSAATEKRHYLTHLGVPLAHLPTPAQDESSIRMVVGGLLRGYPAGSADFMGMRETSLTLLPQGRDVEFLPLFTPGFSKPSYSRAFLSKLNKGRLTYDCNTHGGQRACIACMYCADVCPVDILPQMTYKAILAEEVEEYLEHGLLDCVECGLCSYVCPSKIELTHTFVSTKAVYAKEQSGLSQNTEE